MQMAIGPAYDGLEGAVETTQTEGIRYLDQPPDRRTNLLEGYPEFVNARLGLRFAGLRFSCHLHGAHLHHCRSAGGEGQYIAMGQTKPRQLVAEERNPIRGP